MNWILAILTAPAAMVGMAVAFGAAMGTDRCAYEDCPRQGPPGDVMKLLFYRLVPDCKTSLGHPGSVLCKARTQSAEISGSVGSWPIKSVKRP